MKELKDMKFDELVIECSGRALSSLLTSGGEGLKIALQQAMLAAIDWRSEMDAAELASKPTDTQIAEMAFEIVKTRMARNGSEPSSWVDTAVNELIERGQLSYGHVDTTVGVARSFIHLAQKRFYEVLEDSLNPE